MSSFLTLAATEDGFSDDEVLLWQNGANYRQNRENFAASISNARWSSAATYQVGSEVIGSDEGKYLCLIANSAVNPTTDDGTTWKLLPRNSYEEMVDILFPIGSVTMRMDAVDPSTIYTGQTWTLITGDATLNFGDGTAQSGSVEGSNEHTLTEAEIPSHNHTINHDHPSTTTNTTGAHTHGNVPSIGSDTDRGSSSSSFSLDNVGNTASAGSHSHTVNIPNYTGDSGSTGGGSAHNIQSAYITINIWQRVS